MKTLLLTGFLFFSGLAIACSGYPKSLCYVQFMRPNDFMIKGTITGTMTNSIQMKVLEVLRGTETRSVVTIWDGTDFDCNGMYSMKASGMASVGDTILAVLPVIQTVQNTWDVPGDYRRPSYLFSYPVLKIKNDTLRGLVTGNEYAGTPPYWSVHKMSYAVFKANWVTSKIDCALPVGLAENETELKELVVRQDGTKIYVSFPAAGKHDIRVTSLSGAVVAEFQSDETVGLELENYAAGVYLLCVTDERGYQYRRKVVR